MRLINVTKFTIGKTKMFNRYGEYKITNLAKHHYNDIIKQSIRAVLNF